MHQGPYLAMASGYKFQVLKMVSVALDFNACAKQAVIGANIQPILVFQQGIYGTQRAVFAFILGKRGQAVEVMHTMVKANP